MPALQNHAVDVTIATAVLTMNEWLPFVDGVLSRLTAFGCLILIAVRIALGIQDIRAWAAKRASKDGGAT